MFLATLQKFFLLLLLIQVMVTNFAQHTKANVIKECANYTGTCIETYADIYSALASPKNYFNIALALYPARKPSSVLVHVNLHISNQTEKSSPVPYTWSMSCLYAVFPAEVLEVLSLGSIPVTSRKRELNITIAPFCCNVSKDDRLMMIDRVLAELQDLAKSPGVQDPTLNTAECVIEGHKTDISAIPREHRVYIKAMLWCLFVFTILFGPALATITFALLKTENNETKKLVKVVKVVLCLLSIAESALLFTTIGLSKKRGNVLYDLYVILSFIFVWGAFLGLTVRKCCYTEYAIFPKRKLVKVGIFLWANLTTYYFCWLVIGIMINPLWGFTLLLVICVVIAGTVFLLFMAVRHFDPLVSAVCLSGWVSTVLLVTLVILAGRSFFIRETANEVVKTVLLCVITAFITLLINKVEGKKSADGRNPNQQELEEL